MFRLITPPGMLLTTALLVIYSAYAFAIGWIEGSWSLRVGGALAIVSTYGVAMLRPWSRYFVYALAAGFITKLGHSVWYAYTAGFFEFQFGSVSRSVASLLPGALMALLSLFCCYLVSRHFASRHRT